MLKACLLLTSSKKVLEPSQEAFANAFSNMGVGKHHRVNYRMKVGGIFQ